MATLEDSNRNDGDDDDDLQVMLWMSKHNEVVSGTRAKCETKSVCVCVCVVCCAACDAAAVLCASQLSFQGHCRAEKWAVWASLHWASSLFALSYSVWCALNCVLRREVYLQCSTAPFSLLDWDVFMMSCDDVWWWFIATTEHKQTLISVEKMACSKCFNECNSLACYNLTIDACF